MRKVKKQTAHEGGRNAPVSRLLLCVRLFLDMTENVRQRVRCRRIAGTDEPGVNVRGGAGLCVAQSARNRCNRHMSRYQQAGVGVAQAVEVNRREVMGGQKARKPACNRIGVERLTVPASEQQVIVHRLAVLDLHPAHPLGTDLEPFGLLVLAVLPQQLYALRAYLDAPPGAFRLGCREYRTAPGDVLHCPVDGDHTRVKVNVRPAQGAYLAPAGTCEQGQLCDNAVLCWRVLQGFQQLCNVLFL